MGGNLQTIWPAVVCKRVDGFRPTFVRERWTTPDADFIDVDWLEPACPVTATTPLSPVAAVPDVTVTPPDDPAVAPPLSSDTAPLEPVAATPDASMMLPLEPVCAAPDVSDTLPLEPVVAAPV